MRPFLALLVPAFSCIGNLIIDNAGALYGTTLAGGSSGAFGTVFRLTPGSPTYAETVLYRFGGMPDAELPFDGLYAAKNGTLYGTTENGGEYAKGAVFALAPGASGYSESVIYSFFGGKKDGANPEGSLIADKTYLYGMTPSGGTKDGGVVFRVKP